MNPKEKKNSQEGDEKKDEPTLSSILTLNGNENLHQTSSTSLKSSGLTCPSSSSTKSVHFKVPSISGKRSTNLWLQKVGSKQLSDISEEKRNSLIHDMNRKAELERVKRRGKSLQQSNRGVKQMWSEGSRAMYQAPGGPCRGRGRGGRSMRCSEKGRREYVEQQMTHMQNLASASIALQERSMNFGKSKSLKKGGGGRGEPLRLNNDEDEEDDNDMTTFEEMERNIYGELSLDDQAILPTTMLDLGNRTEDDVEIDNNIDEGFNATLDKLKVESDDDEITEANFKLYEAFASTVEKLRIEVFDLWENSARQEFSGSSQQNIELKLQKIDSHENMGIDFDNARYPFVYLMMIQADKNSKILSHLLREINSKLDLLSEQKDCPICMEAFNSDTRPSTTLACCHKVCNECWEQWKDVQKENHRRAYCPLCRNEEFLTHLTEYMGNPEIIETPHVEHRVDPLGLLNLP